MALYQNSPPPVATLGASHGLAESAKRMTVTVALPVTLAANDVINFGYLPAGAVVRDAWLYASTPLDTNATPTLAIDVGDVNMDNRLFSGSHGGYAVGGDRSPQVANMQYQYPVPTLISAVVDTAAATKAAGNLTLCLDYTVEGMAD